VTKEISLLSQCMRDDMALRNVSPGLQSADVRRCTSVVGTSRKLLRRTTQSLLGRHGHRSSRTDRARFMSTRAIV
jgi:hypothetical protein